MSQKNSLSKFINQSEDSSFFNRFPSVLYLIRWLFISLIIALPIGAVSAGFLYSLEWATNLRESRPLLMAFLPLAGLAIGFLYHYFGKDVSAGNNLLIDVINNAHQPVVPFKMAPMVYLGTIVTHLFGGSAGREGTALQMAGAIADQLTPVFRFSKVDRRVLMISAIAAGFGSVFGTPMAGAIFALEVITFGKLKYDAIFPAFLSAIIAAYITNVLGAAHTHYPIPEIPNLVPKTMGLAILAGITFGLCAATFSKGIKIVDDVFRKKIAFPPFRPFIGGLLVTMGVWLVGTNYVGLGIETIVNSFHQPMAIWTFALKIVFTIVTLGAGFKGGEVTPLFFIGATLGSALSLLLPLPVSLLAAMGFVAVFAGATNTPLACTVMAIELFGSSCGIYVAIACVVSYLFSGHNGIYGKQIVGEPKHSKFEKFRGRYLKDL